MTTEEIVKSIATQYGLQALSCARGNTNVWGLFDGRTHIDVEVVGDDFRLEVFVKGGKVATIPDHIVHIVGAALRASTTFPQ
jgi:hypothetical protein